VPTSNELDEARAQTENARAALQVARNNLDGATLVAPADGVVASINGAIGQRVSGGPSMADGSSSGTGGPFITLTDLTTPQISAQVSEADIGRVHPGQPATFTVSAYPGHTFSGAVATIEPSGQVTSNVVTYNVLITTDADSLQLLPNMTATVSIITERHDDAVLVPNSAISNGTVSVLRDGAPVVMPVETGSTDGVHTEVTSGVVPGDQVVTNNVPAANPAPQATATSDNARPPAA
jgi:RND family efflux transporter MFP subunit